MGRRPKRRTHAPARAMCLKLIGLMPVTKDKCCRLLAGPHAAYAMVCLSAPTARFSRERTPPTTSRQNRFAPRVRTSGRLHTHSLEVAVPKASSNVNPSFGASTFFFAMPVRFEVAGVAQAYVSRDSSSNEKHARRPMPRRIMADIGSISGNPISTTLATASSNFSVASCARE